jgi:hypothetical protein
MTFQKLDKVERSERPDLKGGLLPIGFADLYKRLSWGVERESDRKPGYENRLVGL